VLNTVLILAALLVILSGALVVSEVRRRRVQRQLARVERRLRDARDPLNGRRGRAVKSVVGTALGTAARVRDVGVTSAVRSSLEGLLRWSVEGQSHLEALAGPDGTVTIVFSDIQDSTVHNDQLGDTLWMRVLESHDKLVQSAIAGYGGHIIKSQGDGFMMAFADPADAVRGSLAVQAAIESGDRRLRRNPIRVRVGIHVGKAKERDGDLFGRDVALAARVANQASGGEVLVSDDAYAAIADAPDLVFSDPRDVELKGLAGEYRLWRAGSGVTREGE
jgi:class 3 adenylate cyclase